MKLSTIISQKLGKFLSKAIKSREYECFKQYQSAFVNCDKEIFKNIHYDNFLFILETELLTPDEHVEVTEKAVKTSDFV